MIKSIVPAPSPEAGSQPHPPLWDIRTNISSATSTTCLEGLDFRLAMRPTPQLSFSLLTSYKTLFLDKSNLEPRDCKIFSGEYEQAIAQIEQAIALNPFREQWYDEFLAWAYEESGEPERAIKILAKFGELEGIWSHAVLARAYAETGQIARFKEQLGIMDELAQVQFNERFSLAFWKDWVRQYSPYRDESRAERVITIVREAFERIGVGDRLPRKLAAILYADVAGYSRLTGEDEEGTHRRLSDYLDSISNSIEQHQGKVVHYAGDAVLADFGTVADAVTCATSIQTDLGVRNKNLPDDRKVQFRIGINLGDVIVDRDDIYGDGVNVAARLEGLAEPGGICASRSVFEQIKNRLDLDHVDLGEQAGKNIAEPVHAYRIKSRKAPGDELPTVPGAPPRPWDLRSSILGRQLSRFEWVMYLSSWQILHRRVSWPERVMTRWWRKTKRRSTSLVD